MSRLAKSIVGLCLVLGSGCATTNKTAVSGVEEKGGGSSEVTVKLIAINDLHGYLEGPSGKMVVNGEKVKVGGAQFLAEQIKEVRKRYPEALLVAAGDMVGASPMLSSMFHDEPTIEALNMMKMDVSAVGNHEFDEGPEELLRMQNGGCHPEEGCKGKESYEGAKFRYLAANVEDKKTGEPLLPATFVKEVQGVKVGFIGLTLKGTPKLVSPSHTKNLNFLDEAETINRYAKELQRGGVETIVVLIHEGGYPATDDINGCEGISGPISEIVKQLDGSVDVVISGHTHQAYICELGGFLVTSAKNYGQLMTEVDLTIDRKSGDVVRRQAHNTMIRADETVKSAEEIDELIASYKKIVAPLADRVLGKISQDVTRELDENKESALGRLVADAQLATGGVEGAKVAFMNPGGVRADLLYKPEPNENRKAGDVTYGMVFVVQPFSNTLVTMTLTGKQIREILEIQWEVDRRLFVSKGFSYRYKDDAKSGEHVVKGSMKLGGKVIKDDDAIRVVANGFLADGGDGFTPFSKGTDRVTGILDYDAFATYVETHSPIQVSTDKRIEKAK